MTEEDVGIKILKGKKRRIGDRRAGAGGANVRNGQKGQGEEALTDRPTENQRPTRR